MGNEAMAALSARNDNVGGQLPGFICPMDPLKLARVNFNLLGSLFSLGTSRERICDTMLLSGEEFDYLVELGGFSR